MTSRCPELYFAYGSNLSEERLRKRVGEFGPARVARLEGYRLAFNKRSADGSTVYASIVPAAGATTWGVLYPLSEAQFLKLDGFEGVAGGHYARQAVEATETGGTVVEALTYVACPARTVPEARPRADYLGHILRGAQEHGLPPDYIAELKALGRHHGDEEH